MFPDPTVLTAAAYAIDYDILDNVVTYIHECPFCHAVHENNSFAHTWCEEHKDKRALYNTRGWQAKVTFARGDWECPGCDQCREEKERLA